ncbi:L-type lectin-domain containing receptor kinase VIII.2 [Cardamine amara subsp. amara]|uniref:L-type lectin-domain containing receptor kinase VIII.2 n=1 Tax=Cardamine amara subsp. amara TaxID=228776 RepID=A0ABD0ZMN1_CARAN
MASFILSRSLLILIALFSRITISEAKSSFSFTSSIKDASFESEDIALYGDAKLVDGGSSIQLTDSVSGGRVVYKKPIEFAETKSEYPAGFSTFFSFSITRGRLGFAVFPVNGTLDHSLFEVNFDTSDSNVAVAVNGATVSKKILNFTIVNLEKEKEKQLLLYASINYIASGKFLEVRLSKSESFKSVDPLMFTWIDLSEMLKGEGEFMVGVKSYSGNFNLHSWSLEARQTPKGMHSYTALFEAKRREEEEEAKREEEVEAKRRRSGRMWEIVTCFVMTFGSAGLVFFAMMHIWAAFKRNNLGIKTKEFEYEKMEKMEVVMSQADAKQARK